MWTGNGGSKSLVRGGKNNEYSFIEFGLKTY